MFEKLKILLATKESKKLIVTVLVIFFAGLVALFRPETFSEVFKALASLISGV